MRAPAVVRSTGSIAAGCFGFSRASTAPKARVSASMCGAASGETSSQAVRRPLIVVIPATASAGSLTAVRKAQQGCSRHWMTAAVQPSQLVWPSASKQRRTSRILAGVVTITA